MQRRNSPSILLYGFGLALAFSLVFNAYLLYEQTRQQSMYEYELGNSVQPAALVVLQQQLSDCKLVNQQKDSLISRLAQLPTPSLGQAITVQRTSSK